MRERTFKKVETSMQILWYHIQNDSGKDVNIFPEILKALKEISMEILVIGEVEIKSLFVIYLIKNIVNIIISLTMF